jgi:nicotinate phosphoribosyltransferase
MVTSYFANRVFSTATFSLFIRENFLKRNFFIAAGLKDVVNELAAFRFSEQDIKYLQTTDIFSNDFLSYLAGLRFSGEIFAMRKGTITNDKDIRRV